MATFFFFYFFYLFFDLFLFFNFYFFLFFYFIFYFFIYFFSFFFSFFFIFNTFYNPNKAWKWVVPLGDCNTDSTRLSNPNLLTYDLFWNSESLGDAENQLLQMGQVKFTCKIPAEFQEDVSGHVTINEDEMVEDAEFDLDIRNLVEYVT